VISAFLVIPAKANDLLRQGLVYWGRCDILRLFSIVGQNIFDGGLHAMPYGLVEKVTSDSCGGSCEVTSVNSCDLPPLSNKELGVGSHPRLWRVQDPTQHNLGFSTHPFAGKTNQFRFRHIKSFFINLIERYAPFYPSQIIQP